jgi:hypothetical protein
VIGDCAGKVGPVLPCPKAVQQIMKTVVLPGNEYSYLWAFCGQSHLTLHLPFASGSFCKISEHLLGFICARSPFHPLKENVFKMIMVLVSVKDVAAILKNPAAYLRHNTWSIRPGKKADQGGGRNILGRHGSRN